MQWLAILAFIPGSNAVGTIVIIYPLTATHTTYVFIGVDDNFGSFYLYFNLIILNWNSLSPIARFKTKKINTSVR